MSSILWQRVDTPGHDSCRLEQRARGWSLTGMAVFRHEGRPAQLAYDVACDSAWQASEGHVRGWLGGDRVDFSVARMPEGTWALNGVPSLSVEECPHLDFGFTPATNLFQLRCVNLAPGESAAAPAAWLDVAAGTLAVLGQRYERRTESTYWYEAPRFGYAALLEVAPSGFVRDYPGLWKAEP